MQKIVILDYQNSKVVIKKLPKELQNKQIEDVEEWLVEKGYKSSQIEWMYGDIKIIINI